MSDTKKLAAFTTLLKAVPVNEDDALKLATILNALKDMSRDFLD